MFFSLTLPANTACVIHTWWLNQDRVAVGPLRPNLHADDPDVPVAFIPYVYFWEYETDRVPMGPWPVTLSFAFATRDKRKLVATLHGKLMLRATTEAILWARDHPDPAAIPVDFTKEWLGIAQNYLVNNPPLNHVEGRKPGVRDRLKMAASSLMQGYFDASHLQVGIDLPPEEKMQAQADEAERAKGGPYGAGHP